MGETRRRRSGDAVSAEPELAVDHYGELHERWPRDDDTEAAPTGDTEPSPDDEPVRHSHRARP